eukprot:CAMPEP_0119465714 /NCGR_PEP_ID=MMETSP1344-20130328/708_1 /TAXON_ID=236787 /ORGANISM="Florenciella parvula, Strain CCMP2471" /LENGTH=134 /DNA_ID=CAMNT_0007497991 /DNA_START=1077 /DNA_END=1481 /DNA_ORIENTATION=-
MAQKGKYSVYSIRTPRHHSHEGGHSEPQEPVKFSAASSLAFPQPPPPLCFEHNGAVDDYRETKHEGAKPSRNGPQAGAVEPCVGVGACGLGAHRPKHTHLVAQSRNFVAQVVPQGLVVMRQGSLRDGQKYHALL